MIERFEIREDFIKLGQLIKAVGWVDHGAMAKEVIQSGLVYVNGEVETQRGKKIQKGDHVCFQGNEVDVY